MFVCLFRRWCNALYSALWLWCTYRGWPELPESRKVPYYQQYVSSKQYSKNKIHSLLKPQIPDISFFFALLLSLLFPLSLFLSHFLSSHLFVPLFDISFSVPCPSTARVTGGRLVLWTQGSLGTFLVTMWPLWTPYKLRSELHVNMLFQEFIMTIYASFKVHYWCLSMQVVFWEDGQEGCRTTVVSADQS